MSSSFRCTLIATAMLVSTPLIAQEARTDAASAEQAVTGSAQGTVRSAETGRPLVGARISARGTGKAAVTDGAGRFVLTDLPTGAVTLDIRYLGSESEQIEATIAAGAREDLNITVGDTRREVETVVVRSQRIALNDSLNRYRNSDAISNFVSADDMGQFVDQNVAENLQRLPGISITRDQGEGRFVSIRGVNANLSTVTINGMRIGTPEAGDRAVPLDVIPSGSVELLEVTKIPTPDMPGDAIGGAIDVRSGSPFNNLNEKPFRYRVEAEYSDLNEEINPDLRLNYSNVFSLGEGRDNFGVSAGINYINRDFESDNIEAEYDFNDDLGEDNFVLIETQNRKYLIERERLGANLNLEFRPSFNDTFFFNTLYSEFTDAEERQRSIIVFEDGTLTDFDGSVGRYEGIESDGFRRRTRFRTKEQDTVAASVGGEHVRGDWTMDYRVGHSITRERVLDEREGRFEYDPGPLDATFRQGGGIPIFEVLQNGAPDTTYLRNVNYSLDRVVVEPILVDDNDTTLSFNAERASAFGVGGLTLKSGLDFRTKQKDTDVNETELRDVPDVGLEMFTTSPRDYGLGMLGDGISTSAFQSFFESNRGQFGERPQDVDENTQLNLTEDFKADEDVLAGYLMGTYDWDRWRVIAGVRIEQTDYSADGNELELDDTGALQVNARSVSSDYTNVLPALHLRYEPSEDVVVRAAWSNTIARPGFEDISPRASIDREDEEVEIGNPDLDPFESTNFDLLVDWYPATGTVLSAGIFYKDIDNFIADVTTMNDPMFPGFEVERPVNSTSASIFGLELNAEQRLGAFVPALEDFLVGGNLTLLDTELELAERMGESFALPQAAEESGNLYLGYERGRFSGRLSYSYRGEFIDELGNSREFDIFVAESNQVDLVASYRLTDAFELLVEARNLADDPLELYQGTKATTLQFEEYGRSFALGVKGRF